MQPPWPSDPERVSGYRVLARLGSGGMGQVYLGRARDRTLVAVKVVRDDVAEELFDRFPREVAAAHRANGRYLAELVGADPHGSPAWLATRYVPGLSLAEAVNQAGPLPVPSARALMAGLAAALGSIHRANVLHRDLKPGNVLLVADGPRVIDFGISRLLDLTPLTGPGKIWGSPGYLSPEQVTDPDRTGPASDVFALGAVATYALTGTGPYGDGDGYARVYRLVNDEPDLSRVDPSVRGLIARCLARDPAARPTPAELLAELGEPVEAHFAPGWLPPALFRLIEERGEQLDELIATAPPISPAPSGPIPPPGPAGPTPAASPQAGAGYGQPGAGYGPPGAARSQPGAAYPQSGAAYPPPGAGDFTPPSAVHGAPPHAVQGAPPHAVHGAPPNAAHGAPPNAVHGAPPHAVHGAPPSAGPTRFAPMSAPPPAPRRRRALPVVLAVLVVLAVVAGGALVVTLKLFDGDGDGTGAPTPAPTATRGSSRPADSRPCLSSGRSDLPYYCDINTRIGGDELTEVPLYPSTGGTDEPIDHLTKLSQRQYFVCQTQGSRYSKGALANHWWALTQGDDDDRWGWLPQVYLLGGDNDDPDGGLPDCTPADIRKVS